MPRYVSKKSTYRLICLMNYNVLTQDFLYTMTFTIVNNLHNDETYLDQNSMTIHMTKVNIIIQKN